MNSYLEQYNRSLRLREKLCKKLWELSGTLVPIYEKPRVINNKVTLVQWTNQVIKECDALLIQIEIAKEIQADPNVLDTLTFRLTIIEEIV
jgi:hypothetical protein